MVDEIQHYEESSIPTPHIDYSKKYGKSMTEEERKAYNSNGRDRAQRSDVREQDKKATLDKEVLAQKLKRIAENTARWRKKRRRLQQQAGKESFVVEQLAIAPGMVVQLGQEESDPILLLENILLGKGRIDGQLAAGEVAQLGQEESNPPLL